MIEDEGTSHYVLIKDFNRFMYNQILHRDRKHFRCYCLQSFSSAEILEKHTKDCFEINGKHMIKMIRKGKLLNLKIMRGKSNPVYDLC